MFMAPNVGEWTVADLADMPEDGQRYEVIDGELFVTPSPALRHQDAVAQLLLLIAPYVTSQRIGHAVIAPADVTFSQRRGVQPDLFVVPLENGRRPRELADIRELLLVVEVLSPSTLRADRDVKRRLYREEEAGEYWVVDLDARTIERSSHGSSSVDIVADTIAWHPEGASVPLIVDVERFFAAVLDG